MSLDFFDNALLSEPTSGSAAEVETEPTSGSPQEPAVSGMEAPAESPSLQEPDPAADSNETTGPALDSFGFDVAALKEQVKTYRLQDGVSDLPIATKERQYRVDLTYTVPQDIADLRGTVLYPAGHQFNPLAVMAERKLTYPFMLVIINGERRAEREWFAHSEFDNPRVKLLVTDGYPYKLAEELKHPVYQLTGLIRERFRIEETPTIVFWPLHSDYLALRTVPVPEAAEEEAAHETAGQ